MIRLSQEATEWLTQERATACLVRACFQWLKVRRQLTASRITGLVQLTWITKVPGTQEDLGPQYELKTTIPGLKAIFGINGACNDLNFLRRKLPRKIRPLLTGRVGISNYRTGNRGKAILWIKQRKRQVIKILQSAARMKTPSDRKRVFGAVKSIPGFNGALWPLISCLDPHSHFPIISSQEQIRKALSKLGVPAKSDLTRFKALSAFIGQAGITDAFFLDTAALYGQLSALKTHPKGIAARRRKSSTKRQGSSTSNKSAALDWQDDQVRMYVRKSKQVQVRQLHRKMTNALAALCLRNKLRVDKGIYGPQQFDALVFDYESKGRHLLIEIKSTIELLDARLAIGQLFDYRRSKHISPMRAVTDLAVLFPQRPSDAIRNLLSNVGIKALWFETTAFSSISGDADFLR